MRTAGLPFDFTAPGRGERPERPFEAKTLPEAERLRLCEDLLSEFGVSRVRHNARKHELIHSCPIPGAHPNGDRNPSAALNYEDLVFRCLGCGAKGGLLWFVATCRQDDSVGAREWLEGSTGLGGQEMDVDTLISIIDAAYARAGAREPIPRYSPDTLDPWLRWRHPYPMLTDPPTPDDPPGLRGWGIPAQTLWDFRVGYAPDYEMRMGKKLVHQERIIIPHFWNGELVGWQARRVDPGDDPKYKSTPEFPKDRTLFNYDRKRSRAVVVEAPKSVLRHYHHVPELVGTFGAAVTEDQMRLLRGCDEVIVWFDPDEGGYEGTRQIIDGVQKNADVRVVASPWDVDLADLPDEVVDDLIAGALPWPIWEPPQRLQEWA